MKTMSVTLKDGLDDNQKEMQTRFKSVALLSAVLFSTIVALICFFLDRFRFPINPDILPTHVSVLEMESSLYQRLSYVVLVAILAAYCLMVSKKWLTPERIINEITCHALVVLCFFVLFISSEWSPYLFQGFGLAAFIFLLIGNSSLWSDIEHLLADSHLRKTMRIFLFLLLCTLIAILWLRPIQSSVFIPSLSELIRVDGHYSVTVLSGYDLTQSDSGQFLKNVGYGLGLPILTAICIEVSQFFGNTAVSLPTVVKIYQLFAALLLAAIFYVRDRRTWVWGTLIVLITLAFTLANTGKAVKYPNQSGIRFIPIIVGILGVAYELRKDRFRIGFLSPLGGSLLLLNIETGLAFTSGIIAALFYKELSISKNFTSAFIKVGKFVALEAVVFLTLASICMPLLFKEIQDFAGFLALFGGSGYGGLQSRLSLTACVVIITAAYTLVENAYIAREKTLDQKALWEVFLAAVMLVWMTYYMNRMDEWNLWFQWIPLTLWLFSRITFAFSYDASRALLSSTNQSFSFLFPITLVALVTFGQMYYSVFNTVVPALKETVKSVFRPANEDEVAAYEISGFKFENDLAEEVKNHLEGLQSFNKQETLVFTNLPTLVRLQGYNGYAPMYSPMGIVSYSEIPASRQAILQSKFRMLVFDDPSTSISKTVPELNQQIELLLGPEATTMAENHGEWTVLELSKVPSL
jgi:hypothetical protein